MKQIATLPLIGLLVFTVGCGESEGGESTNTAGVTEQDQAVVEDKAGEDGEGAREDGAAKGTEVVLGDSEFGEMLYDENDQAIYVFERDPSGKSACYDECAVAWPPVPASGEPVAGEGIDASLLGTTERRDGNSQITYGGRPLYYYAHEGPGEVRCHNVDLNGGFWWVVGRDGEPLS
jgi:predicted lipoprotein with Yx(FWY)xxD motif